MVAHCESRLREVYLDANATTPVLPVAARAAQDAMQSLYGNPSSSHVTGLRARYILEYTRDLVRRAIGASNGQVIFTSGATEGIQTAIFSSLCEVQRRRAAGDPDRGNLCLLYGATEHKAVPEALVHWNKVLGIGAEVLAIPVGTGGELDLEFLVRHVGQAALVCTMAVNNETGVIQDLADIEQVIRVAHPEVLWMVDCVQALAKIEIDLSRISIDYALFSGHKLYATKGIGVLYVRKDAAFTQMIVGGGQENGLRSGTENLPGVAALGAVLESWLDPTDDTFKDEETLTGYRDQLVTVLRETFPDVVFNTPFERAVPTTINFSVKGFPSKEILDLFDAAGIRVSSGSACGSGTTRSYVLDAMGLPAWQSESAIRLSFGPAIHEQEVATACARIRESGSALRQSCLVLSIDVEAERPRQDGLIQLKRGSSCSWIYACAETRSCFIVDPIADLAERIVHFVACQRYTVRGVVDTHSHADHVSCRPMLQTLLQPFMDPAAASLDALGWPTAGLATVEIGDGTMAEAIRFSDSLVIVRTPLPGHTDDSHLFLVGRTQGTGSLAQREVDFALTGDTLLVGGIGRTDFSNSTVPGLYRSLLRLPQLIGPETIVCPAHDYGNDFVTTLPTELAHNRLLARVCDPIAALPEASFVAEKTELDRGLLDASQHEIIRGMVSVGEFHGAEVAADDLPKFLAQHPRARLVDVREPHEYRLSDEWTLPETGVPSENVPLSRFAQFLRRQAAAAQQDSEIIFICRSGARSSRAAATLRRLGLGRAWNVAGGIALRGQVRRKSIPTGSVV